MTSLYSDMSQGFPGVPGGSGSKVSVQMLGGGYGQGLPRVGAFSPLVILFLRVTVGRLDPKGNR